MIDMIRVGQTRNLLRASSSLLETWPRSAHHHPGQRRQSAARTGLTKDRTRSHVQTIRETPCKPSGIHKRRLDLRPVPSATCPRESVLPIRLRPDFLVVFEGYAGGAEHWPWRRWPVSGLCGRIFSGPDDYADLVNCLTSHGKHYTSRRVAQSISTPVAFVEKERGSNVRQA
jgi:hypothetical protein